MSYLDTIKKNPLAIRNFNDKDMFEFSHWVNSKRKCFVKRKNRQPTKYNNYMATNIRRLKKKNPNIPHREIFKLAAQNWTIEQQIRHPCKKTLQSSLKDLKCPACDEYGNIVYSEQEYEQYIPPDYQYDSDYGSDDDSQHSPAQVLHDLGYDSGHDTQYVPAQVLSDLDYDSGQDTQYVPAQILNDY